MKVLYKSNTDYVILPSKDPFVQAQQALLIEMGYRLIEDWEGPTEITGDGDGDTLEDTTENASEDTTEEVTQAEKVYEVNGKTITESELKALAEKL